MQTSHRPCEAPFRALLQSAARFGVLILAATVTLLARPSFVAAQATCSSTAAITCGGVQSGSISAIAQTDCFTFTAQAGEVIQLLSKATGASPIEACAQLRNSAGNIVATGACNGAST